MPSAPRTGTPIHERNVNGTSCTSRDSSCGFVKDCLVVTAHRIRAPLATCPNDQGGGKTSARHAPTRPRLHHTEDLCHQWGGIARRARPEKRAPSMRPTHTHLNRRAAHQHARALHHACSPRPDRPRTLYQRHTQNAPPQQPPAPRARTGHPCTPAAAASLPALGAAPRRRRASRLKPPPRDGSSPWFA